MGIARRKLEELNGLEEGSLDPRRKEIADMVKQVCAEKVCRLFQRDYFISNV
jgi:hypothetical protein